MKLELIEIQQEPLVKKSAAWDSGIAFGYEGGTAHKVGDTYYIFTTECFAEPKTAATRLALYTSMLV